MGVSGLFVFFVFFKTYYIYKSLPVVFEIVSRLMHAKHVQLLQQICESLNELWAVSENNGVGASS